MIIIFIVRSIDRRTIEEVSKNYRRRIKGFTVPFTKKTLQLHRSFLIIQNHIYRFDFLFFLLHIITLHLIDTYMNNN